MAGMGSDKVIMVQGFMCNELNLSGNELLIYAIIYGFSHDGMTRYRGGRGYISKTINVSMPTVDKALKSLIEKKLIIKVNVSVNNDCPYYEYYADLQVVKNLYTPRKETLQGEGKETLQGGSQETLHSNIVTSNSNTGNKVGNRESKATSFNAILDSVVYIREDAELRDTFVEFIKMRKLIKKPLTDFALKKIINEACKLANGDPELIKAIVEQSIVHSWQGVFPLKDNSSKFKQASSNSDNVEDGTFWNSLDNPNL